MSAINFNQTDFIKSAASPEQFIETSIPKIAFAGKSNVGKSSVINAILNRRNFAKVGAQPGKTIHVNYFLVNGKLYLIDLPGYGFAKVSQAERERWGKLMENFFAFDDNYNVGVLIVDARHRPSADDITMAKYFYNTRKPYLVVANKVDKLKKSEIEGNLELIRSTLNLTQNIPVIPLSAETGTNRDQLISTLLSML